MTTWTTFSSHITSVIQVLSSLSMLSSILSKTTWDNLNNFFSRIPSVIQVLSLLSVLSSVLLKTTWDNLENFFLAHHFCHTAVVVVVCVVFCSSIKSHRAANPFNRFYPCSRKKQSVINIPKINEKSFFLHFNLVVWIFVCKFVASSMTTR